MATNDELLNTLKAADTPGLNPDKYEGVPVKIEQVEIVDRTTDYTEDNKYTKGLGRAVKKLRIASTVLEMNEFGKELRIEQEFSLKPKKDGTLAWSPSKKGGVVQLLAKFKVNSPTELIGKEAKPIKKINPETGRAKLVFL